VFKEFFISSIDEVTMLIYFVLIIRFKAVFNKITRSLIKEKLTCKKPSTENPLNKLRYYLLCVPVY
jgi:hypothetical protein